MRRMNIQEQVADVCRRFGVDQGKALDMIAQTAVLVRAKERKAKPKAKLERGSMITGRCVSGVPMMVGFSLEHWPKRFAAAPRALRCWSISPSRRPGWWA